MVVMLSVMTRAVMTDVLGLKTEDTFFTDQLAEASRLEKDLLRFRLQAEQLARGESHVSNDDVRLAYALVSSRIKTEVRRAADPRIAVLVKYGEALRSLTDDLQALGPVVRQLHAGDSQGIAQIDSAIRPYDAAMENMNRDSYAALYKRSSDLAIEQRDALQRLDQVQWVTLVVGIFAFLLLLIELSRSEKLYREVRAREAEIRGLASTDPLTGLSNRRYFDDYMQRIDEGLCADNCHLLMIDLDGFKAVNDHNGHEAGDYVLIETARRLSEAVPQHRLLARLGGDEFALLVSGDAAHAQEAADAILKLMALPFLFEGKALSIGASIGISMRRPGLNVSAALKREADLALYEAKAKGRNRACQWQDAGALVAARLAAA